MNTVTNNIYKPYVNNANYTANKTAVTGVNSTQETETANVSTNNNIGTSPAMVVEKSNTATKYQVDFEKIDSLYAEQKNYMRGLQSIINQFQYQSSGAALLDSLPQSNSGTSNNLYNLAGMSNLTGFSDMQDYFSMFVQNSDGSFSVDFSGVSPEAANQLIDKAKQDISDDGYWGVTQTSERILSFAEAITGGDPAKMEKMQKVVEKAFQQVGALFGGVDNMPDISQQTYSAIMQGFENFAAKNTQFPA